MGRMDLTLMDRVRIAKMGIGEERSLPDSLAQTVTASSCSLTGWFGRLNDSSNRLPVTLAPLLGK